MPGFHLASEFQPTGDQPQAIQKLTESLRAGRPHQTLLGVTGSGKTFTMANLVQQIQRPTLVMAHNKTLAAQLASEFKEFFPTNAVEYFVSYYDYYQPEAYIPRTDTYIEKDSLINEDIERLRHSTMQSLLTRRDTLVVASVSCIFGLGDPEAYGQNVAKLRVGEMYKRDRILRLLIDIYYERNDFDLSAGKFRVRGDTLEVHPASQEIVVRISFWGDEVERIAEIDPLTGEVLAERTSVEIYPARYFVTSRQKLEAALKDISAEMEEQVALFESQDKLLEAQRLRQRTQYDVEMLSETGGCAGVENYSRHLSRREPGSTPWTLMDYFPSDFVVFVDESHMTIPQVRGMFNGDRARKEVLVEFGFRLPSALDNRPLQFHEFEDRLNQTVYVSATPGPYELTVSRVPSLDPDITTSFQITDWTTPRPGILTGSPLTPNGALAPSDGDPEAHPPAEGLLPLPPSGEPEAPTLTEDVLHFTPNGDPEAPTLAENVLPRHPNGEPEGRSPSNTVPPLSQERALSGEPEAHTPAENVLPPAPNGEPEGRSPSNTVSPLSQERALSGEPEAHTPAENVLPRHPNGEPDGRSPSNTVPPLSQERALSATYGEPEGRSPSEESLPGPLSQERPNTSAVRIYGAEQLIRPTGLLDPEIQIKPTRGQIDDLMEQIRLHVGRGQRILVTTLTKRMAEDLADFLRDANVKVHYLHSEVDTLERVQILRDLRLGVYDVVVGINLLREGLDLPEVALVAILDADKEGYLRSNSSLIQTIGRAARHVEGRVIMYADRVTDSMRRAIEETYRRRARQQAYNEAHGITPVGIQKAIRDINERVRAVVEARQEYGVTNPGDIPREELQRIIRDIEKQMKEAAKALEFERAALLRDQVVELKRTLAVDEPEHVVPSAFLRAR